MIERERRVSTLSIKKISRYQMEMKSYITINDKIALLVRFSRLLTEFLFIACQVI